MRWDGGLSKYLENGVEEMHDEGSVVGISFNNGAAHHVRFDGGGCV